MTVHTCNMHPVCSIKRFSPFLPPPDLYIAFCRPLEVFCTPKYFFASTERLSGRDNTQFLGNPPRASYKIRAQQTYSM